MIRPRAECRSCGRDQSLTEDDVLMIHGPFRNRCPGSGMPPKGEPPCSIACGRLAGTVSYPADLMTMPVEQVAATAHVSTYACFDPEHQADAAEWVRSKTGHTGVFAAMKEVSRVKH